MASSKVYVISCPDYGHAEGAVRELICRMGGMERFVRPGERIFLKVNLLAAARPEVAIPLYEKFVSLCREKGIHTETGEFGAEMLVESVNDGPLTLVVDTDQLNA